MEVDDPFDSISENCRVPPSEEELLRHTVFIVGNNEPEEEGAEEEEYSYVSLDTGEVFTGIIMLSVPDSLEARPEGSLAAGSSEHQNDRTAAVEGEALDVCTEAGKTVDLGADTDIIFSNVELAQRHESETEVIYLKSKKARVSKVELAYNECLNANLNCNSVTLQNDRIVEVSGESSAKRRLDFSSEVIELDPEPHQMNGRGPSNGNGETNSNLGRTRKSIEDFDKYRYVDPSVDNPHQRKRLTQGMRTLPASLRGQPDKNAENERSKSKRIALLNALKMLSKDRDYDISIKNKSILDIAKSRGMIFP